MGLSTCIIVGIILTLKAKVLVNADDCTASAATASIVKSCPQTVSQWKEAAVRKGCDKFTHPCSSFEYHCVINVWINETIEVCAPRQLIVGKVCAEYNFGGERIQRNENAECSKCPSVYFSNDSLYYPECYEYVTKSKLHVLSQNPMETTSDYTDIPLKSILSSSSAIKENLALQNQHDKANINSKSIIITVSCVVVGIFVAAIVVFSVIYEWRVNSFCTSKMKSEGRVLYCRIHHIGQTKKYNA